MIDARRAQIGERADRALESLKEKTDGRTVGRWIERFLKRA
jgi:hypothetical protein